MLFIARRAVSSRVGSVNANLGAVTELTPWTGVPITYANLQGCWVTPTKLIISGDGFVSQGSRDAITRDWQYVASNFIRSVSADQTGNVYYLDVAFTGGTALKQLSASGVLLNSYGANGAGVDQLSSTANQIITNSTLLYIADGSNRRIVIRNVSDLSFAGSIAVAGGTNYAAYGVALSKTNIFTVGVDLAGNAGLKKFTLGGVLVDTNTPVIGAGDTQFSNSANSSINTDGSYLYIADNGNNRIKRHLCADLSYVDQLAWGAQPFEISSDEWWNYYYGNISYAQSFASGRGRPRRVLKAFNPADII